MLDYADIIYNQRGHDYDVLQHALSNVDIMRQVYQGAFLLCANKHYKQARVKNWLREPYGLHCVRTSDRVSDVLRDFAINNLSPAKIILLKSVGLMHDLFEDTDATADDMFEVGIPRVFSGYVWMVTRNKEEDEFTGEPVQTYAQFIDKITRNEVSTIVKLADIADNMSQINDLEPDENSRLTERYSKARVVLVSALDTHIRQGSGILKPVLDWDNF